MISNQKAFISIATISKGQKIIKEFKIRANLKALEQFLLDFLIRQFYVRAQRNTRSRDVARQLNLLGLFALFNSVLSKLFCADLRATENCANLRASAKKGEKVFGQ